MKDVRPLPREPVSSGPSMLAVLVSISTGAFLLRMFAVPTEIPPGALSLSALQGGQWWAVLTHIFTHADIWHLLSNMVVLFLFGRAVERNAGSQHFVYVFLASAWAGAAVSMCFHPDAAIIGASGGMMGIVGAFTALHPEYDLMRVFRRFVPLRLKAKHLFPGMMVAFVGLEVATRVIGNVPGINSEEAHLVHAGGMLAGWLYGRRIAVEGRFRDEWHDFFPQGLRRRSRESNPGALPVAAGFLPGRNGEESQPGFSVPARELSDTEFLHEQVDPVLEKLYASGADKLTEEERAILEEASRRFSRLKK
jgi:membrane associated rhomboid family serine protease